MCGKELFLRLVLTSSIGTSFDRFAIDPSEVRPLTTSDLDSTLDTRTGFAKPFSPLSAQPTYPKPPKPMFSQDFQPFDSAATRNAPFSQYAPSFSPTNVPQQQQQSLFKPATQSQISSQLTFQQNNKTGFSLMSEQSEEKPEEDDFYGELWEFYKNFKKRVSTLFSFFSTFLCNYLLNMQAPPLGTVVELSKIFAELCDTR